MKLLSEGKGASENSYQINTKLWNTYRDNEYGFYQFKYPEDWYSFSRLGFNRISSASIDDFTSIKLLQGNAILNSQTLYKNKEVSLEEWIGQKPFNEKDVDVISKSTIKVAKKNSPNFKYSYKNESQEGQVVFIPTDKYVGNSEIVIQLDFYYYQDDEKADYYNAIFESILDSLELLDIDTTISDIEASVFVYHMTNTTLTVQINSNATNITRMKVWSDTDEAPVWEEFQYYATIPWKKENNTVYVQLMDTSGNISRVFQDTARPPIGPPDSPEIFCGGIAGIICPEGYECKITEPIADAGGICVPKE